MPELSPEMIAQLDADAQTFLDILKTYEDAHLAASSAGYLQVLPTHTVIPADGVSMPPDNLTAKPSDQELAPTDLGWSFGPMPFSAEVHVMQRGELLGYVAQLSMRDGTGSLYIRRDEIVPPNTATWSWAYVDEAPSWLTAP